MTRPRQAESAAPRFTLRRSEDRGVTRLPWLDSRHTFSFGEAWDPQWQGWSALRVLNDDRVAPARGFGMHAHRDMEILTIVLSGALEHRDSLGNGSVLRPGDIQRMTAGRGISHSEWNHSPSEPLHLLQIWIRPEERGLEPSYEERHVPRAERRGRLQLLASRDGNGEGVRIHQDARVWSAVLGRGETLAPGVGEGRSAWLHVVAGEIEIAGSRFRAGDGFGAGPGAIELRGQSEDEAEILFFDLPPSAPNS